jgi:metal-responsive CopG/Arc/MetJ family transcriptional regulator
MTAIKTAVSIDKDVFAQVEEAARELQMSRSRVVGIALGEFLKRRTHQRLIEQINAAYDEAPLTEEEAFLQFGRRQMRRLLGDE